MLHEIKTGKSTRMSFSKVKEVLEIPDLIAIQKDSFQQFLKDGLREVLHDVSPITDYSDNLELEFLDYYISGKPKYDEEECKERDVNYAAPIKVKVRLYNKETGEVKEQDVFMGDFPLMTDKGTFVINGAERVIVSQLVRSPGVYYDTLKDKSGKDLFTSQAIPNRGAWLELESDSNDCVWIRVDRTRKIAVTIFLRAMGLSLDSDIGEYFGYDELLDATIKKDTTKNTNDALLELYRRLRPGDPATVESATSLVNALFFDNRRYDLARVGRYKFNKKLALAARIIGLKAYEDIINKETGEFFVSAGELISEDAAWAIQNSGINEVLVDCGNERPVKVSGNNFVDASGYLSFDPEEVGINEMVHYPTFKAILDNHGDDVEDLKAALKAGIDEIIPKYITIDDMMAHVSYFLGLRFGIGVTDDIDHLSNRRLRSVGELLQNQMRVGIARLERVVRERMSIQDMEMATPSNLINIRPVTAAIKEFFGSSQLSQFMDQTNPLAELTNKRRLSALGPGGLNRDRASFEVRDVHHSHYGRMCPIETPEGPNIGLISALSTYAKINEYGFIESPYRIVDKTTGVVTDEIRYMCADEEDLYVIAQANEPIGQDGRFTNRRIMCRIRDQVAEVPASEVDLMDVSPMQLVSVATAMIPFLENDDSNRALMGANMQRQAVPLLVPQAPIVGTGMEGKAAYDSGVLQIAKRSGIVRYVDARNIEIITDDGDVDRYRLIKYSRSNQGTCINQHPLVYHGQRVEKGEVIADGPSTDNGEIALGRNVLIGFMSWEGYNYEDAVLLSERMVIDDVFTSIHIEEYECQARDTKLGPEEITRDIPNVGEDVLKDLDSRGIIRIGAEVTSGDVLVGKVTPKGETDLSAEERLLRAIFGEKAREVRDTSLRVPHGQGGVVVDVKLFTREDKDELTAGVNKLVRVYIAQKRKITVGDKMAGRHGNKGVISRVLPVEDMPFLPDGTPLDIVLNPLGVPSRMNLGQVLEVHLGLAAKMNGWKVATPVFDGATEDDIEEILLKTRAPENAKKIVEKTGISEELAGRIAENGLTDDIEKEIAELHLDDEKSAFIRKLISESQDGKTVLFDGRTGQPFENRVTVGYMYMQKLHHLVDDKIHARSTGPYSLVTQQPLGGKAQFGGQRFGEMEVWALEAYGAANTLQEILTVKSDDVVGRVKTYESIVKGENIPAPGVPESFKVLIKEMQSLCLDVRVLGPGNQEIELKESDDDDVVLDVNIEGTEDKGVIRPAGETPQDPMQDIDLDNFDLDFSSFGLDDFDDEGESSDNDEDDMGIESQSSDDELNIDSIENFENEDEDSEEIDFENLEPIEESEIENDIEDINDIIDVEDGQL